MTTECCHFQGPQGRVRQETGPGSSQEPRAERQGEGAEGVAQGRRRGGQQGRQSTHQHQSQILNLLDGVTNHIYTSYCTMAFLGDLYYSS